MKFKTLYYITSNARKVFVANQFLNPHGFKIEQKVLDLVEYQSADIKKIAIHKAQQAFKQLKHPLFVNDAGWYIPAYNGFPGPFMKYMGEWFAADDWLHLMSNKKDKTIHFLEINCYIDKNGYKTFEERVEGKFITEKRGKTVFQPLDEVVSLSPTGKTIAECHDEHISSAGKYLMWSHFAEWLKKNK